MSEDRPLSSVNGKPSEQKSPFISQMTPHGRQLIDRCLRGKACEAGLERADYLVQLPLTTAVAADLYLIATGAYSPLTGFMASHDYQSVIQQMRLANGLVWPLPITLPVARPLASNIHSGDEIALVHHGRVLALLEVSEKYGYDKQEEAYRVYGTTDAKHPGVAQLCQQGDVLLAGDIYLLNAPAYANPEKVLAPSETRQLFANNGWQTIVGFQTRNAIHGGHEYVFKHALELVDGLLLHPLIGQTKADDTAADIRMLCYQAVLGNYPPNRTSLAYFPAAMRYAGPREAVFHALCRQNYGCTHFIVGRDHAGVGRYYEPEAAVQIFRQFDPGEIAIQILSYAPTYYCPTCSSIVTSKTCGHVNGRLPTSGSLIRDMLAHKKKPPTALMRPEVSDILMKAAGYWWDLPEPQAGAEPDILIRAFPSWISKDLAPEQKEQLVKNLKDTGQLPRPVMT